MALTPFAALSAAPIAGELAALATALRQVTLRVRVGGSGEGSGVVWHRDGLVLTNALVARDPDSDLAALRPGALVFAFGHPLGVSNALAFGAVHHVAADDAGEPRWIKADVRLAPGNSGGPLADASGRVVGINTLVAGGLGYAVPLTVISRFLQRAGLSTTGRRAA